MFAILQKTLKRKNPFLEQASELSYLPDIQIRRAANPSPPDINTINPVKSIHHRLTSIHGQGIGEAAGDDFDRHSRFDADAVELGPLFGRDEKSRHNVIVLVSSAAYVD